MSTQTQTPTWEVRANGHILDRGYEPDPIDACRAALATLVTDMQIRLEYAYLCIEEGRQWNPQLTYAQAAETYGNDSVFNALNWNRTPDEFRQIVPRSLVGQWLAENDDQGVRLDDDLEYTVRYYDERVGGLGTPFGC